MRLAALGDSLVAHAATLLTVAAIAAGTAIVARVATTRVPRRLPSASVIRSVVRIAVWITGALVALAYLGISIAPLLTALGVGGLAVALALRDTLANLFAGIQLLASGQVSPGDYVRFEGGEGVVADVTWRNTTLIDLAGARVVVPNEKLAGSVVVNATGGGELRFSHAFALPRAIAPSRVREALVALGGVTLVVTGTGDAATSYLATLLVKDGDPGTLRALRARVAEIAAELSAAG